MERLVYGFIPEDVDSSRYSPLGSRSAGRRAYGFVPERLSSGGAMPILIGAATACLLDSSPYQRPVDRAARDFVEALLAQTARPAEGASLARFLDWAAGWLRGHGIAAPVFFPMPPDRTTTPASAPHPSAFLAAAIAGRIGLPSAARTMPRWETGLIPPPALSDDPEALRRLLVFRDEPPRGEPVIVGDVFRSEALLRACALKLSDAGLKPMFALFAAREASAPAADPFAPEDQQFFVRP